MRYCSHQSAWEGRVETDSSSSRLRPVPVRVRPSTTEAVVTALRVVVDEWADAQPLTVAVTGWSRNGRPHIGDLLRESFPDRSHVISTFDAHLWEGESRSPAAMLAAAVARAAAGHRTWLRRVFQPVATEMSTPHTRWRRRLAAGGVSGVIAAGLVALPNVRDSLTNLVANGGLVGDRPLHRQRS